MITPRWLFVLAGATPAAHGRPHITDETLEALDFESVQPGDVVGVGIHTGNALRGYEIGTRWARLIATPCRHFFTARPLPDLKMPAPH